MLGLCLSLPLRLNLEEEASNEDAAVDGCPAQDPPTVPTTEENFYQAVEHLPAAYKDRFGEICWANGGGNYGWWPAIIFDPTAATGSPRKLAQEHLGRKHLVYFLECHDDDAPFMGLEEGVEVVGWEEGMIRGCDAARPGRSNITKSFNLALRAALDGRSKHATSVADVYRRCLRDGMDGTTSGSAQ